MSGDRTSVSRPVRPAARALLSAALITALTLGVVLAGVGLVAALGRHGNDSTWTRWSSVGEAFGVVNSVVSGLALAALLFTIVSQSRQLQAQRDDLARQRQSLEGAEAALRRSADLEVRNLHVALIRMAIEDPTLAEVWPSHSGTDATTRRQHMYANLLLQHVWLQCTLGLAGPDELTSNLRHLFSSPRVRNFWKDTAPARRNIYVAGSRESSLAAAADDICREFEAVLACSDERTTRTGDAGHLSPGRGRHTGAGSDFAPA